MRLVEFAFLFCEIQISVDAFAFADVESFDFRILTGSVAIDACPQDVLGGLSLPGIEDANVDFDGNTRTAPGDCGAFQYNDAGKGGSGFSVPNDEGSSSDGSSTMIFESNGAFNSGGTQQCKAMASVLISAALTGATALYC